MSDFFLFIDTETTDVPKKWDLPYSDTNNWPSAIQIAWLIISKDGKEIKKENYYIYEEDLEIADSSFKVHNISLEFLKSNGVVRNKALSALQNDIEIFQPIIVGHFIEFDIHVLSSDYYRSGLENPFKASIFYCTMLRSRQFVLGQDRKYMKLWELYAYLFGDIIDGPHNAAVDAARTAQCFLELREKKYISDKDYQNKHKEITQKLLL